MGLERLLVAGQADETHLGLRDEPKRRRHQPDAGAQDRHQHRDVGQPLPGRRTERRHDLDDGRRQAPGGLVDQHAAEAVERLSELGVERGGLAEDGEALGRQRVVDNGDFHRRGVWQVDQS